MYIIMNGRSTWRYGAHRADAGPTPTSSRLYRSTPGNKGAYALRRIEGDTAHFLMVTFWESEVAIRAFAGDDISVAKYYDFDKDFLLELEPCSAHYEMYDR